MVLEGARFANGLSGRVVPEFECVLVESGAVLTCASVVGLVGKPVYCSPLFWALL